MRRRSPSRLPALVFPLIAAMIPAAWARAAAPQGPATPTRRPAGVPRQTLEALYRPTVTLVKGSSRGSGTIIASFPGESLILTAAHVIAPEGDLNVELQPYNFGVETDRAQLAGPWPRRIPGEVAARDDVADVAVVRLRSRATLPYVARLALQAEEPRKGDILTSVGVDQNNPMTGWRTDVRGTAMVDIGKGGTKPFTLTTKPPEHGRSGGGLFLPDGAIVGVCVGRLTMEKTDPTLGVFASITSIRELIQKHELDRRIAHSEGMRRLLPPRRSTVPRP